MKSHRALACSLVIIAALSGQSLAGRSQHEQDQNHDRDDRDRNGPRDGCEQASHAKRKVKDLPRRRDDLPSSGGAARGDFNGDTFADLVISIPFENEDGVNAVGAVHILYGSSDGLKPDGPPLQDQLFDATTFGFPYQSKSHSGWALAAGNFNGDEYSGLAISMPDYDRGGAADQGVVFLIDGSESGLVTATGRQGVCDYVDGIGIGDSPEDGDGFGTSLAVGTFHGGADDLVIGVPYEDLGLFDKKDAGLIHLLRGNGEGLIGIPNQSVSQMLTQDTPGVRDEAETGDRLGAVLATGNLQASCAGRPACRPPTWLSLRDTCEPTGDLSSRCWRSTCC